jgi:hypothetical protein
VEDLDRQVLALLAEDLLLFLLEDLARAVMGIDDAVADLVLDQRSLSAELEVLDVLVNRCFGNDGPPLSKGARRSALVSGLGL